MVVRVKWALVTLRAVSPKEPPTSEPDLSGPAIRDSSTPFALRSVRSAVMALPLVTLLLLAFLVALWLIGAAVTFMLFVGLAIAVCLAASVVFVLRWSSWNTSVSRLLAEHPWREAKVKVFRPARGTATRLLVHEPGAEPLWLHAPSIGLAGQQVFARTGRIWLVGPDDRGHAAVRSTGLTVPLGQASVANQVESDTEVITGQEAPARLPLAADDAVLAKMLEKPRRQARTELIMPGFLLIFAVVVFVLVVQASPRPRQGEMAAAVAGIGVLLLAYLAWKIIRLRYWQRIDKLLAAGPWTSSPATLDPVEPYRGPRRLSGTVILQGAEVPFTLRTSYALAANIAATGLLWVAGTPAPGTDAAAGLPGHPLLEIVSFRSR